MFVVNAYKTIEPALAGVTLGAWPTFCAMAQNKHLEKFSTKLWFAAGAALAVLGSTLAMSPKIRLCSAFAAGGVAYLAMNYRHVRERQVGIAFAFESVLAVGEIYQGQRLNALGRLAGSAALWGCRQIKNDKKSEALGLATIGIGLVYPAGLAIKATISGAYAFAALSRRTKLGSAAGALTVGVAAYYFFRDPSGPGAGVQRYQEQRQRQPRRTA